MNVKKKNEFYKTFNNFWFKQLNYDFWFSKKIPILIFGKV